MMLPEYNSMLAQAGREAVKLTVGGATIMTLSIAMVVGLLVFCMYRVLRSQGTAERLHAPQEIETDDLED